MPVRDLCIVIVVLLSLAPRAGCVLRKDETINCAGDLGITSEGFTCNPSDPPKAQSGTGGCHAGHHCLAGKCECVTEGRWGKLGGAAAVADRRARMLSDEEAERANKAAEKRLDEERVVAEQRRARLARPLGQSATAEEVRLRVLDLLAEDQAEAALRMMYLLGQGGGLPMLLLQAQLELITGRIDASANSTSRCPQSAPPCVQHKSTVAHARLMEARAKFKRLKGDWLGAFRTMSGLIKLCRRSPSHLIVRAQDALMLQLHTVTLSDATHALRMAPQSTAALWLVSYGLYHSVHHGDGFNQLEKARQLLRKCVSLDPDYTSAKQFGGKICATAVCHCYAWSKRVGRLWSAARAMWDAFKQGQWATAIHEAGRVDAVDSTMPLRYETFQVRCSGQRQLLMEEGGDTDVAYDACTDTLKLLLGAVDLDERRSAREELGEAFLNRAWVAVFEPSVEHLARDLNQALHFAPSLAERAVPLKLKLAELKEVFAEDFYKVLGVPRNATFMDIKKAYRKLAKAWHPDKAASRNATKAEAEARFRWISEAYSTLADFNKRAAYDNKHDLDESTAKNSEGATDFEWDKRNVMDDGTVRGWGKNRYGVRVPLRFRIEGPAVETLDRCATKHRCIQGAGGHALPAPRTKSPRREMVNTTVVSSTVEQHSSMVELVINPFGLVTLMCTFVLRGEEQQTPLPATDTPLQNLCVDEPALDCGRLVFDGECEKSPSYMRSVCPRSCSMCNQTGAAACADNPWVSQCAEWADEGECTANEAYMKRHCCRSCADAAAATVVCEDDTLPCVEWAAEGECTANGEYMKRKCCSTCEKHQAVHPPNQTCKDDQPACAEWASVGECSSNPEYMRRHCCGSCLKLSASTMECEDDPAVPQCAEWATDGECESNPEYMRQHCCSSCDNIVYVGHLAPRQPKNATYNIYLRWPSLQVPKALSYIVDADDVFSYEMYWEGRMHKSAIALDLVASSGLSFRNTLMVDQSGSAAHPAANLSAHASDAWFDRRVQLSSFAGSEIESINLGCEYTGSGLVRAFIRNIKIESTHRNFSLTILPHHVQDYATLDNYTGTNNTS